VKLCVNLRRPRRKAKYSLATDSEQVPRGKGEKHRCERSEIVPEIIRLQGVKPSSSFALANLETKEPRVKLELGMACLLLNESASYCQWQA
jgi:hypothetical protein